MLEQPQAGLISRFFRQVENRLKNKYISPPCPRIFKEKLRTFLTYYYQARVIFETIPFEQNQDVLET